MKTLLRILIALLLTVWLGAEAFFPVVASLAFQVLPDRHNAALVVRAGLLALHREGLVAGGLLLILLAAAARTRAYGRRMLGPVLCCAVMLLLTALSQWSVLPRMEADQLGAGGDVDRVPPGNAFRADFDRLHVASVRIEGGVLLAGVLMLGLLARPEATPDTASARALPGTPNAA